MASEVISALFSAKDELSPTLNKVQGGTRGVSQAMDSLQRELRETSTKSNQTDVNLHKVKKAADSVAWGSQNAERHMSEFDRTMDELGRGAITTDEAMGRVDRTLKEASSSTTVTSKMFRELQRELGEVSTASNVSNRSLKSMTRQIQEAAASGKIASEGLDDLSRSSTRAAVAKEALNRSVSRYNKRISTSIPATAGATQQLGLLAAVAAQTSFEMSSLSINIGPFNLALKNLLLQLPAILVGLGSAVAVVSALAAAFVTAGAAAAAFIAGGLIKFLDDLGEEFDEAGQALEVFMAALKDLFKEAMEPLMTEANVDLFIASINTAARVVNRFAQFFQHMREDVLSFFGEFGGDLDEMFNALERTFLRMEPILLRFVNFLTDRAPGALEFFAERTEVILESLAMLAEGFRNLFNELLVFAGVVINAVAPVLAAVVVVLGEVFDFINRLDDSVVTLTAQFIALSLAAWKIHSMVTTVTGGFSKLNGIMKTQATQSGALARMWRSMVGILPRLAEGEITLAQAKTLLTAAMQRHMTTLQGNIRQYLKSIPIIGQRVAAIYSLIAAEVAHHGVLGAIQNALIRREITSLRAAAASMAEAAATAASTAAYVAKQAVIWGTIGAVKVLHVVTGGLTKLMALAAVAVVSLAVLLWELVKAVRNGSSALSGVKSVLMFIADVIIGIVVPIINLLISVFNLLAAPMRGIINGFRAMADAIGGSSDEGDDGVSTFSKLGDILIQVVDVIGLLTNVIAILIEAIADLLESAIILFFETIGRLIGAIIDRVRQMIDRLVSARTPFESVGEAGVAAFDLISRALDQVLGLLDSFIGLVNAIPGVDIDAPSFDAGEVRQTLRAEEEEEPDEDEFESEPEVNLSFEDAIEQNIEVDADPEDREQMRRTVKDAMNEANALQRRRE